MRGQTALLPDTNGIDADHTVDGGAGSGDTNVGMSRVAALRGLLVLVCLLHATSRSAAAQEYEIGPADVLNVLVLGQAPMSGEMAVDGDGMLAFPFLGRVKASGLSPSELERKL